MRGELQGQGSAHFSCATGRIPCGAPHDRGLLFLGLVLFPPKPKSESRLIRREADTNYAGAPVLLRCPRAFCGRRLDWAVIFAVLRQFRRRRLQARPFPKEWLALIQHHVVFFPRLSASDRAELLGHVQVFLAEKRFEGCGGFTITDEVRVTIAAQACLLLLHRKTDYFPGLLTILVYPLTYMVEEKRQIGEHVWEEGTVSRLGETGRRMGSLVLSWGAVKHGAADPSDGKNVVLHEFAHQLDYENHAADGVPGLATRERQLAWSDVMRTEFASLRAADETEIPTLLDIYGATNPVEFFAVSVEAFFEQPHALRSRHPKLYAELRNYFQQDPVEFSAE